MLAGGPDAVLEVLRRLGSIQLHPVMVAGRSHDLVLHARVADYDLAWCDELYERREIVEAYNKGLARAGERVRVVPRPPQLPLAEGARRQRRRRARARTDQRGRTAVIARLRARDRSHEGLVRDLMNAVRAVLEAYAKTGELGTARRDGNHRLYDLPERFLPAEVLRPTSPCTSSCATRCCRAIAHTGWSVRAGTARASSKTSRQRTRIQGSGVPRQERTTAGTRRAGRTRNGRDRRRERQALRRP